MVLSIRWMLVGPIILGACTTDVIITAQNEDPIRKAVTVEEKNEYDRTIKTSYLGDVPANQTRTLTKVEIDDGNTINISTPDGFRSKQTVSGDPDPLNISVSMRSNNNRIITDAQGLQFLAGAFQYCGEPSGFPVADLGVALQSLIGKVVVYRPGTTASPDPIEYLSLPVGTVSQPMSADQVRWSAFVFSDTQEVSSKASAEARVNVPVYASVTASLASTSTSKYHIETSGNGIQYKPDSAGFELVSALNTSPKVTPDMRRSILEIFKSVPEAVLVYLSQFYGIRNFRMEYFDATSVTSSAEVSAGSTVFTTDGAFNFATTGHKLQAGGDVVINITGPAYRLKPDPDSPVGEYRVLLDTPVSARLKDVAVVAISGS